MFAVRKIAWRIILLVSLLPLTACNAQALNPDPTADLNLMRTQVAETVVADLTVQAALHPSATATSLPPTETPIPSPTVTVTLAQPTALQPTIVNTVVVTATSAGSAVQPTRPTKTPYTDAAAIVTQDPPSLSSFSPKQSFKIVWGIQNLGMREWDNQFYIRFVGGTLVPKKQSISLPSHTGCGEVAEVELFFRAPEDKGRHTGYWRLYNDDGVYILSFSVTMIVE